MQARMAPKSGGGANVYSMKAELTDFKCRKATPKEKPYRIADNVALAYSSRQKMGNSGAGSTALKESRSKWPSANILTSRWQTHVYTTPRPGSCWPTAPIQWWFARRSRSGRK